ncbi:MAG: hypothetical protein OXI33_05300 [Chloroflexota bacterium]|nr:hypothetical protein [Chloroflexota bacterium]
MTDAEKQERVGKLAEQLSKCVTNLNGKRKEANGLALALRVIADCFDNECPEVNVLAIHDQRGFTFSDRREEAERHVFPPGQPRRLPGNLPVVRVPDGDELMSLMEKIHQLSREADNLNGQLRTEGFDLKEIGRALRVVRGQSPEGGECRRQ